MFRIVRTVKYIRDFCLHKGRYKQIYLILFSLDLDAWINDPPSESEDEEDEALKREIFVKNDSSSKHKKEKYEPSEEELQKVCISYTATSGISSLKLWVAGCEGYWLCWWRWV